MDAQDGAGSSEASPYLIDNFLAEAGAAEVHVDKCPTVLDNFAQFLIDVCYVLLKTFIVILGHLHDIVPSEVKGGQSAVFLQDF